MSNTFVTVDLDYWTMTSRFRKSHTKFLQSLINKTSKVAVVKHHHHVVTRRMIPAATEEVINIDFHNDIVDNCPRDELNEGTWGNFLPKRVKKFTWVYPDYELCINECKGICCGGDGCMRPEIQHVEYVEICGIKNIKIDSINKLVICISEDWAEHDVTPYLEFLQPYRI